MKKTQSAKLNMYNTVDNCLGTNAVIVATVPALATARTDLQAFIQAIEVQAEIQNTADTGAATDKEEKQTNLCRLASNMAGLIRAWAVASSNTLLAEQMNITYSDLLRIKDSLLAEHCLTIHAEGTTNLVALAPYGVTAPKLTQLQTAITDYEARSTAPRDADVAIAAATEELETLFKSTDSLLKLQIDKMVNDFRSSEPIFFNQYYAARVIVDGATQHSQATGLVTLQGTDVPISDVAITVEAQTYTATSEANGEYTLLIPVPGTYTLHFTKAGYVSKTVANVVINLGQTTTLNVQLIAV
jgi:hypothetical protein